MPVAESNCPAQVTKDFLMGTYDQPWWEPGDGSSFIHRMIRLMVPDNSPPCQMHGQMRVSPRVVAIYWFAFHGVPPPRAPGRRWHVPWPTGNL